MLRDELWIAVAGCTAECATDRFLTLGCELIHLHGNFSAQPGSPRNQAALIRIAAAHCGAAQTVAGARHNLSRRTHGSSPEVARLGGSSGLGRESHPAFMWLKLFHKS